MALKSVRTQPKPTLFQLLIRDLSTGSVIRQHREKLLGLAGASS
jgi:hypothetical protein